MIHLKSEQYYSDLYDRHTVEQCRRLIRINQTTALPLINGQKPTPELEDGIIEQVCNILEGGELSFSKRKRK